MVPKEPRLEFRREERVGEPVDSVGDEVTGVKEEPKELSENGQCTAKDIEYGAPSVVCTMKEPGNVLEPADWVPPIRGNSTSHVLPL